MPPLLHRVVDNPEKRTVWEFRVGKNEALYDTTSWKSGCWFFQRNNPKRRSAFSPQRLRWSAKLPRLGFGEVSRDWRKTNATRHRLARILARRPYFFENEAGRAATVNGARYRDAITRFFLPKLDDIDAADTRFRRDGATCRAANQTIRLPRETFPGRALSRFGDRNRPPGSRDLTPLDFFLRDCSRWKVHVDDPATTRALREEIKRCVDEIRPRSCGKVMKNLDERVRMCPILCTLRLLKTLFYIRFKFCVNFGHSLYT